MIVYEATIVLYEVKVFTIYAPISSFIEKRNVMVCASMKYMVPIANTGWHKSVRGIICYNT